MSERKHRLVDCEPHWVQYTGKDGPVDAVYFDCPEGHDDCRNVIPFTPALDGTPRTREEQRNHAQWQRTGDTFETLTLSPSIARRPQHASREAAVAAGCLPEHVDDSLLCALHIFIKDGVIEFCGDSK